MSTVETKHNPILKIVFDSLSLIIVYGVWLILITVPDPHHQGFFCDDQTISYPYIASTISTVVLTTVGIGLTVLVILIAEGSHYKNNKRCQKPEPCYVIGRRSFNSCITRCYTAIGCFLFGLGVILLLTNIGKYSVGRLRPHFLDVCKPDYTKFSCLDSFGNHRYVDDYVCTNTNKDDAEKLEEMRLSFPSGHASISIYCMLFLALYCHARLTWEGSKLIRHVLQAVFLSMALYTCLSRVIDNKHHPTDVLAGAILGVLIACLTIFHLRELMPNFHRKRVDSSLHLEEIKVQVSPHSPVAGPQHNPGNNGPSLTFSNPLAVNANQPSTAKDSSDL